MELTDQADDIVLGRRLVAQPFARLLPDFLDRAASVHQTDETLGFGREAVELIGREILQDVPGLSAILMPLHAHVASKSRLQAFDPVPG